MRRLSIALPAIISWLMVPLPAKALSAITTPSTGLAACVSSSDRLLCVAQNYDYGAQNATPRDNDDSDADNPSQPNAQPDDSDQSQPADSSPQEQASPPENDSGSDSSQMNTEPGDNSDSNSDQSDSDSNNSRSDSEQSDSP
jgi:hypothetical protein